MNIQPISMLNCRKPQFSAKRNDENTARPATVQDLYDMEARIKAQNAALFAKQNKLIGKTLDSIARVAYLTTEVGVDSDVHQEFDEACDNARLLIHNGQNKYSI